MSTPSDPTEPRPLSRREAREAAARAADDSAQTPPEVSAAPEPAPVAAPEVPAEPVPAPTVISDPVPARTPVTAAGAAGAETASILPIPDEADDAGAGRVQRRAEAAAEEHDRTLTDMDALFAADPVAEMSSTKKRKRRRGCLIGLIVMALVLGGIGVAVVWAWNTYGTQIQNALGMGEPTDFATGLEGEETSITVAEGDTGVRISQSMFEAGVTKTGNSFYNYLVESKQNPTFYPGVYKMRTNLPAEDALAMLQDPANKLENAILIREGESAKAIYANLATVLGVPVADVEAAAKDPSVYGVQADSLEGWLFPATYELQPGTTPQQAIQTLVDRMRTSLAENGVPEADQQRILTIASIIQREARYEADFFKVSRVIENRLKPDNDETHGLLQMDSTAQYGVGQMDSGAVSSTDEALESDNPWNTYLHPGLPIGPIASPGDVAIDAAMHPADGPWMYFVTVNLDTGETKFTNTLAEHNKVREEWISWCNDHPDSGC